MNFDTERSLKKLYSLIIQSNVFGLKIKKKMQLSVLLCHEYMAMLGQN